MAQRRHLAPWQTVVVDLARGRKLPDHRLAVLAGFLVDVPDLQRFLSRISIWVSLREVRCIQVLGQRLANRQLEFEQVLEGEA